MLKNKKHEVSFYLLQISRFDHTQVLHVVHPLDHGNQAKEIPHNGKSLRQQQLSSLESLFRKVHSEKVSEDGCGRNTS